MKADAGSERLRCSCREYMICGPQSTLVEPRRLIYSATVGLLSVPDIQSTSKAAGIVSVFASMGSMITGVFCLWRHQTNIKKSQSVRPFDFRSCTLVMPLPLVYVFTQRPSWCLWVTWSCNIPQLATCPACVGHHRVCHRLHCVHSSGLVWTFRQGGMGRRLGSFNRIVAHAYSGCAGPLYFRSYVEPKTTESEGGPGRPSTSMRRSVYHSYDVIQLQ
jgi:hypothetical protein